MPRAHGTAGRREEARTLALACLVTAGAVGTTVLFPFSPTAPRTLGLAFTVLALALAAGLWTVADRARAAHIHLVLGVATVSIAVSVGASTTPSGTLVTSVSFLWVALFSALHHRPRVMVRYLYGIVVGLGAGLWASGAPSPVQSWFFMSVTFCSVAVVLNHRVVRLRQEATTDALTGALSRRAFRTVAELEMARARRTGDPLTLVVLDLDDFKLINDERGHATGDDVLRGLVQSWRGDLRAEDVLGRFGGDEFTVLLPHADRAVATAVVSRLSDELCSWSAGMATWQGEPFDAWFARADDDLYQVKSGT